MINYVGHFIFGFFVGGCVVLVYEGYRAHKELKEARRRFDEEVQRIQRDLTYR